MNILSVHYNDSGNKTGFGDFLKNCYDAGHPVGVIYSLNGNIKDTINRNSPGTKWVYRRQSNGWLRLPEGFFSGDPIASAYNWLTSKRENKKSLLDIWRLNKADWFDPLNEPVIELPDNPTPEQLQDMINKAKWLNSWMLTALEIAHQNGFKLAMFSFNFGSPPYEVWKYLITSLQLGKKYGAILSLHSYTEQGPLLQYNPDGSFTQTTLDTTLRHRKIYAMLPENARLPLLYSEFSPSNGYGVGEFFGNVWINDVVKCAKELSKDDYIIGLDGFQLGGSESNLVNVLGDYTRAIINQIDEEPGEDMPLDIVVVENLIPQDTNETEFNEVQKITQPIKQDIMWSADTAKYLVKNGLPGSKVIVWNPERWKQGSIIEYLGVPTEIKYFSKPTPPPPPPPVVTNALRGVQMRADGNSTPADFQCITVAKLNAAKIMTNTSFEELQVLSTLVPVKNVLLRLFTSGDNPSLKNAYNFVDQQSMWLNEFARKGGKYVEIHNEPNLPQEGLGFAWSTPDGFANWYKTVYDLIKSRWPTLHLGYPGLSPQPNVGEWQASIQQLVSQNKVDWIGAHSYWLNATDMRSITGGQHYRTYLGLGRPVLITEFANVGQDSHLIKGEQYKEYYSTVVAVAAYAFITSASDPQFNQTKQTWTSNGVLNDIPRVIGNV